jgi:CDP-glucose 4,6-dehydratase
MGLRQFGDIYRGRRVLLTGHTGFKGSWLAAWLASLGAHVTGLSLDPIGAPNHWDILSTGATDLRGDIRERDVVARALEQARPEIVFHLAAKTLVRESYADPLGNWSTNVMGTANVLEACRHTTGVRAVVAVTTDKVYANREWCWGYRENDPLGGHDPYSASKAATELVVESYRKSFWHAEGSLLLASARAGNVIGGGDWAADRLVPDLVRSLYQRRPLEIRSPNSTRPWQHVLECLSGYLLLGQRLLNGERDFADAWNFGPAVEDNRTVADLLALIKPHWPELDWSLGPASANHEAGLLLLDCTKARKLLGWRPVLGLEQGLAMTARWYREHGESGAASTERQLREYIAAAAQARACWVEP